MLSEANAIMASLKAYEDYAERHNIRSAPNLTLVEDETAELLCSHLAPRIAGKTIVEIGGGIAMLSLAMATVAKRIFCIEANPMWASTWTQIVLERKPRNMSYLFGGADEFVGSIRGDVAVVCTHSDVAGMKLIAQQFAPSVIDVYGEMISENPTGFDPLASRLRAAS
jgi:predicted RNA methylase